MKSNIHARLSPSGAEKWMACPGSVAMEAGEPDSSNDYSDEGTAAHFLASTCLENNKDAVDFKTQVIAIFEGKADWSFAGHKYPGIKPRNTFLIDSTMCEHVQVYLDKVREYTGGGVLLVEQRMAIDHITGEEGACGTADAVIVHSEEIIVIDLKYGMREVDGERNKQLMIYALASLKQNEMFGDFSTIRTVIIQPRIGHYPEWSCSVDELLVFGEEVTAAAEICKEALEMQAEADADSTITMIHDLNPGPHCQKNYCKARATCPALHERIQETLGSDFEEIVEHESIPVNSPTCLGTLMSAIPMIEDWCKAVRAKVEAKLFAGEPVPGYKLVQGKKGNRKWNDEAEAEAMLKGFKLKVEEMYDLKLITPPTAEKLAKAKVIGPRQWPKLGAMITQSEGSPSVAPESDKRLALVITPPEDDFEVLENAVEEFADMM